MRLHGGISNTITPSSGIPVSGYHSWSLLFSLLVNGATSYSTSRSATHIYRWYKICMRIQNLNDNSLLLSVLDRLVYWGKPLVLSVNVSKCHKMSYFVSPTQFLSLTLSVVTSSNSVRYLGFRHWAKSITQIPLFRRSEILRIQVGAIPKEYLLLFNLSTVWVRICSMRCPISYVLFSDWKSSTQMLNFCCLLTKYALFFTLLFTNH